MRLWFLLGAMFCAGMAQAAWFQESWDVMGTRATLEYQGENRAAAEAVRHEFDRLNQLLSPWISTSELYLVNAHAAERPVQVSSEFLALLQASREFHRLTGGAFDVSFASAGHLYDYREGKAPDEATLSQARKAIGLERVKVVGPDSVRFLVPGTRLDFGGIAKGYAIDRAVAILRARGIDHAYVSLGGDSYVMGSRGGRPWQVGIRHPRKGNASVITLPLSDVAVSTSGDYERYFLRDGERVHHILDPSTGKSAGELASVTILAPRSIDADALSTSVFVLGRERGLALVESLENVSAILIDREGRVHHSADLAAPASSPDAGG